jgi:hypothetical protein
LSSRNANAPAGHLDRDDREEEGSARSWTTGAIASEERTPLIMGRDAEIRLRNARIVGIRGDSDGSLDRARPPRDRSLKRWPASFLILHERPSRVATEPSGDGERGA